MAKDTPKKKRKRKGKALEKIGEIGADPEFAEKQVNWKKVSDAALDRFQVSGNPAIKKRAKLEIKRRAGVYL